MSDILRNSGDLPSPSAEIVLWRVSLECFIAVIGKRKGQRFIRLMTEKLASEESLSTVLPIRPDAEAAQVRRARRQAIEVWQRYLPTFLARLPDE